MKITIENEGVTCTAESEGVVFDELYALFKQCAMGVGFHPTSVTRGEEEE